MPYAQTNNQATYIDPSVGIVDGNRIAVGKKVFVAPYVALIGSGGFITIGDLSTIRDNATILANPGGLAGVQGVSIGASVAIDSGAIVRGPSTIGANGTAGLPTYVGPTAIIDQATIAPGAWVSALARVGPGVIVPAGIKVLPGANVTTEAEATNPALGKVVPVTAADQTALVQMLADDQALATGYTTLYQGNSATGPSPVGGLPTGVFQGDLAQVTGISPEAGTTVVSFEPSKRSPEFLGPGNRLFQVTLPNFPARITGGVTFHAKVAQVAHAIRKHVAIRGDVGQPITFASAAQIGAGTSIHAVRNGKLTIGQNFSAGSQVVLVGGASSVVGDNVSIGDGAVVTGSSLGTGTVIGSRSAVINSKLAAGTVIPPGVVIVNNILTGKVQS